MQPELNTKKLKSNMKLMVFTFLFSYNEAII